MFSIATVGIVVLAVAIVVFVIYYQKRMLEEKLRQQTLESDYQQKMLLAAMESQENERQRIAGDLHDSIGAMLSTIRLNVATLSRQLNKIDDFQQAKKMIDDTIDSVRKISRDLMPATLQQFGLMQAVKEICTQYAAVSGIPIEYLQQGEDLHLDRNKEIMVFRIVQELLNNAIKHAQCSSIQVIINTQNSFRLEVNDNGVGFNFDEKRQQAKGIGLYNIQNRASLLSATLVYERNRPSGTSAILTIPWA
jgi:signal transduction histidine kinase